MKINRYFVAALLPLCLAACSDNDDITAYDPLANQPAEVPDVPGDDHSSMLIGTTFSFQQDLRNGVLETAGKSGSTTVYNLPVYDAAGAYAADKDASYAEWWDQLAEQMSYAGLDYVAADCRGTSAPDTGDPTRIQDLIAAFKRRGEEHVKIAIFDDTPQSWAAKRNKDLYNAFVGEPQVDHGETQYPIDNLDGENGIWQYIWDKNLKPAFANFYGANSENSKYLFRYKGRPVLYMWSPGPFLKDMTKDVSKGEDNRQNCDGKLAKIFARIHTEFKKEFGEDVFIIIDKAFLPYDKTLTVGDYDAMHDWFSADAPKTSYTIRKANGTRIGMAVPQFRTNDLENKTREISPEHGKTLSNALKDMQEQQCDLVFLEGLTDMLENAAYWRSTDQTYYDFPNQRLNILRKYSTDPYPADFMVEAEACDSYVDNTPGNSGGAYRKGNLDIKKFAGQTGWYVTDEEAGESLFWNELPFRAGQSTIRFRYAAQEAVTVRIDIDGREGETFTLPATGADWKDADSGVFTFKANAWHTVRVNVLQGKADIDYFRIVSAG